MGKLCCLGREYVLHYKKLDRRQCAPDMIKVRVCLCRVFSEYAQALDTSPLALIQHLNGFQTSWFGTDLNVPRLLELFTHLRICYGLITRERRRQRTEV